MQNAAKSMVFLSFSRFHKQNDGIPAVFASVGRFWQETRWKSLKNHKFYIKFMIFLRFFYDFLWFPRVLARFQPPSGAKCSKINGFP